MIIRPYTDDDASLWREPVDADDARKPGNAEAWQLFITTHEPDLRCRLIAVEDNRCIGWLHVARMDGDLFRIVRVRSAADQDAHDIGTQLFAHLASLFSGEGLRIFSSDRSSAEPFNAMMAAAGYAVAQRKVRVERDLQDYTSPDSHSFTFRSLVEVGESEFIRLLTAAATDDPFEDAAQSDPDAQFRHLVEYAGKTYDPSRWVVAYINDEPVGVVLPQVYEDALELGTLFYIGVLPEHRRRGYGVRIHTAGLEMLVSYGALRYVGSTDARNEGMIAVFKHNGCQVNWMQLFYKAPQVA